MKTEKIKTIKVKASSEYDVLIGENLIDSIGELMGGVIKKCKVVIKSRRYALILTSL